MDEPDVMLMLSGVSRMCPDCGELRVFVPAEPDAVAGACCCTACGAALLIDVEETPLPETARRTA
jgi:hypothetical protein